MSIGSTQIIRLNVHYSAFNANHCQSEAWVNTLNAKVKERWKKKNKTNTICSNTSFHVDQFINFKSTAYLLLIGMLSAKWNRYFCHITFSFVSCIAHSKYRQIKRLGQSIVDPDVISIHKTNDIILPLQCKYKLIHFIFHMAFSVLTF